MRTNTARRSQERPGQVHCPRCDTWKAETDFYRSAAYCKSCHNEYKRAYEKTPSGRESKRRAEEKLRRKKGIRAREPGRGKRETRREKKARVVAILGGRCQLCAFSGWLEGLHAHHLHPEEKHPRLREDWGIVDLPLYALDKELSICCLLCANCHAGVESGHLCLEAAEDPGFGPNWQTDSQEKGAERFRNPLRHQVP